MSLPSLGDLSGALALAAGLVCCSLALFIFRNAHGPAQTPGHTLS